MRPGLAETVLWTVTGLGALLFVATVLLWFVDKRLLGEASVWAKPMKFAMAVTVHTATMALVVAMLGTGWRTGSALAVVALVYAAACAGELGYIVLQAAHRDHLRAHVSSREPIVRIAFDTHGAARIDGHADAAAGFADRALGWNRIHDEPPIGTGPGRLRFWGAGGRGPTCVRSGRASRGPTRGEPCRITVSAGADGAARRAARTHQAKCRNTVFIPSWNYATETQRHKDKYKLTSPPSLLASSCLYR